MDHRVFRFATRGQCIKGKKLDSCEHNHVFCLNCNVLALLSFTHCHLVEIERRGGPFHLCDYSIILVLTNKIHVELCGNIMNSEQIALILTSLCSSYLTHTLRLCNSAQDSKLRSHCAKNLVLKLSSLLSI